MSTKSSGSLLRATVFSGCMLLALFGAGLAGIYTTGRVVSDGRESRFHRMLGEYDFRYRRVLGAGQTALRQELDGLEQELTRLERRAEGVEPWLSILKRRRQLTEHDPHYRQTYVQSSQRAALAFPHSEPIAAVAAAALVYDSAISREGEAALRGYLPLLLDSRFAPIRLSLHVLLGDFAGPHRALADLPEDLSVPPGSAGQQQFQAIFADLAILKILAGDTHAAVIDIWSGLAAASDAASPELIRLAAEFSYDFGDLLRSAELFSLLPDEAALGRQADALWLAGYSDSARGIWAIQADSSAALYNLALTAQTREEAEPLLKRLTEQDTGDVYRDFGLIRYSRLFDAQRAIRILEAEKDAAKGADRPINILTELETLRRRTEIGEVARVIAETWMLVERFPDAEDLYQWGAWYFDLQRSYTESALLHSAAERHGFTGQWLGIYGALQQIREGSLDTAEEMLVKAVSSEASDDWAAHANLGRVLETRRAPRQALASYERALAALTESGPPEDWQRAASRIHARIAFCLRVLDRQNESREALERALELDPDNLKARLELSRQ